MVEVSADIRTALEELKAEYFFCVDNKLWDRLIALFTPEARFSGTGFKPDNPADFAAHTARVFDGVHSQHFGFHPSFAPTATRGEVRGRWSMQDFLTWDPAQTSLPGIELPGAHSLHGFGYYEDSYRKTDGAWKISSMRLVRTRIDISNDGPRPTVISPVARVDHTWLEPN